MNLINPDQGKESDTPSETTGIQSEDGTHHSNLGGSYLPPDGRGGEGQGDDADKCAGNDAESDGVLGRFVVRVLCACALVLWDLLQVHGILALLAETSKTRLLFMSCFASQVSV